MEEAHGQMDLWIPERGNGKVTRRRRRRRRKRSPAKLEVNARETSKEGGKEREKRRVAK